MPKTSNMFNWIILCAVALSGVYFIYYANAEFARDMNYYIAPLAEQAAVKNRQAVLILDYAGKKRVFAGAILPNMAVADVLAAASQVGGFEIKLKPKLIIDGRVENGKKWKFLVNGKEAEEPVLERRVRAGDEILGKYE